MGKRELLIISAFIVVGVLAYQLTAPPAAEGSSSFSLTSLMGRLRREARGQNRATATVTTRGTITAAEMLTEMRISSIRHVTITGGTRPDIAYELTVESSGPDDATAKEYAARTLLTQDNLGPVLTLRANSPKDVRQVASLSLTIPAKLSVRIEGTQGSTIEVTGIAGVQLDAVVGDVRLNRVAGTVIGTHRNGELSVTDTQAVNLTLVASKATFDRVRGPITLTARNGRCRIVGSTGAVELEATNEDVQIVNPAATVRIRGNGGAITVEDPHAAVNVDVRRASIEIGLARAVPLTILTTDAPLRLRLTGAPSITLDAVATDGGTIDADAFSLTPETIEQETRVRHAFGTGTATVALRNRRAAIVIGATK